MPKPEFLPTEARKKLERFCIYQERCHQEAWAKLYSLGISKSTSEAIVSYLIEQDFLNETRFACGFARGKFNQKKWGKDRILLELKKRNISDYNCNKALLEINEADYEETFSSLFEKRKKMVKHYSPLIQKRKIMDYLLYRGWEKDRIYTALNS
mgnify:FL=1